MKTLIVLFAASGLAVLAGCRAGDGGARVTEYRPGREVERLAYVALAGDEPVKVQDFDLAGDTIYLLDRAGRIAIVRRTRTGDVLPIGSFGRRGAGPGEFLHPTGLAFEGGSIIVVDGTRLQFFSRSGRLITTRSIAFPCAMMVPAVAPSRTGLFLAGGCYRGGYATDTMKAVLAWSADTVSWHVVAEAARYTRDGKVGTVFGARGLFTTGVGGLHSFGGGELNCLWLIDDTAERPSATAHCPAVTTLYSADPPAALRARMRDRRIGGMNVEWPRSLPVYLDRFVTDAGVVLLRPYSADSLVLQLAGPTPLDLAVAPLNGLLGCKAAGCVWLHDEDESAGLIVLERDAIEARIRALISP